MEVIRIIVENNELKISSNRNYKHISNFINSGIAYNDELHYTLDYIKENQKIVEETLSKIVSRNNIKSVYFSSNEIAFNLLHIIKYSKNKVKIFIDSEMSIDYKLYKKLLILQNVKSIKCYFMPDNYISTFGKRRINIYFTFVGKFTKEFISDNNLKDMKNIYYKKNIICNKRTFDDFKLFLSINKHLKIVNLYEFNINLLKQIIKVLDGRDITILILQSEDNTEEINKYIKEIRNINKEYIENTDNEIRLVYSDELIEKNIFKQLTYSNLKICTIIILYLSIILLISNKYNDFVTWANTNNIINDITINENVEENNSSGNIVIKENKKEEKDIEEKIEKEVKEEKKEIETKDNENETINTDFRKLLDTNSDLVGWIKVNDTKINYPVVKTIDNEYYINHDFYKKRTANGWVFMDYRNRSDELDDNTIIYAHSLLSGYMFGDLHKTRKSSWFNNEENLTITFNTLYKDMKWKVISIYKTPYTNDYLIINFDNENEFNTFITSIKNKSIHNFKEEVKYGDKLLTLSTCAGNGESRLVLHAKLIE